MLEAENVLFDGVKSAEPPISSGISFTKKSKHTLDAFLVAMEESFKQQSLRNSSNFVWKLFGIAASILLSNSDESFG